MRIAITGTPGVGKTTVAERLADKLDTAYVDLTEEVRRGASAGYDDERKTHVADIQALDETVPEDGVLDGHVAHRVEPDYIVVLRCAPEELRQRLAERGWSDEKIRENVESEVLDVVLVEALGADAPVFEYDTTDSTVKDTVGRIEDAVRKREDRHGTVDWTDEEGVLTGGGVEEGGEV